MIVTHSRFEVDVNRARNEAVYCSPEMAWGLHLWKGPLDREMIEHSLEEYDDFYRELEQVLTPIAARHRHFVVFDLHTYNYCRAGPDAPPEDPATHPEVNVGTGTMDRRRCAPVVERFIHDLRRFDFLGRHLDVRENVKFRGRQLAKWIHEHFPQSSVLAVEFKKFFMGEWTGEEDKRQIQRQSDHERLNIDELDVLMLRNNPADDVNARPWARLVGINFGRLVMRNRVIVLNDPNGLSQAVNKMYLQAFPREVRPRSLITRDSAEISAFIESEGGWAILKPLAGSGGRNVFLVHPKIGGNLNQMIDAVATEGYIIAEQYLPEGKQGDTRLFLLNVRPFCIRGHYAAFHRQRKAGDIYIRSNMTTGAISVKVNVTDEMLHLAELVRPKLIQDGMFLVGLDIVGDKLLEINVFSPGGLEGAGNLEGVNFCREVILALERKVEFSRLNQQHFDNVDLATL